MATLCVKKNNAEAVTFHMLYTHVFQVSFSLFDSHVHMVMYFTWENETITRYLEHKMYIFKDQTIC